MTDPVDDAQVYVGAIAIADIEKLWRNGDFRHAITNIWGLSDQEMRLTVMAFVALLAGLGPEASRAVLQTAHTSLQAALDGIDKEIS